MNILVIGNGFDLAHELPTKYWDFMMFIQCVKEKGGFNDVQKAKKFNQLSTGIKNFFYDMQYFSAIFSADKDKSELRELLQLIKHNVWINYFLMKINEQDRNKGWIDFELEISQVVKSLSEDISNGDYEKIQETFITESKIEDKLEGKSLQNFNKLNKDIQKEAIDILYKDLESLIRCLEIYLGQFVSKIQIGNKIKEIENISNVDKILSFNYTNTYEKYYETNYQEDNYDYIHGKIRTSNKSHNNMVLGIDEYLDEDRKNKEFDFIKFKKYYQRIYKKTGCKYKRWVEEIKKEYVEYQNVYKEFSGFSYMKDSEDTLIDSAKEIMENKGGHHNVYIFGHSLDITDGEVLKDLILLENVTTTIFYYNEEAYAQQIVNLVKVIGQDTLINMVYGNNPRIVFEKQS